MRGLKAADAAPPLPLRERDGVRGRSMLLRELKAGGKSALAKALADLEAKPDSPEIIALLDEAYENPVAQVIGLTGPPGVGKSTLAGALIDSYRQQSKSVGVIA